MNVHIVVPEDAAEDASSIELAAREYARQLLDDLALPARPRIRVKAVAAGTLPAGRFELAIGARDPILAVSSPSIRAVVPLAIYRQRRHFATVTVLKTVAKTRWPNAVCTPAMLDRMRELLVFCADRNCSYRRAADLLPNDPAAPWDPWEIACRVHTDDSVAIALSGAPADAAFDWTAVQASVFSDTGVLCPIPVAGSRGDLTAGELEVRINDVRLPLQTMPPDNDTGSIVTFVEQSIRETLPAFVTCDSVRQRLAAATREVPVLAGEIAGRLGIAKLCRHVAKLVALGVPIRDFHALLDGLTSEVTRYRDDHSFATT